MVFSQTKVSVCNAISSALPMRTDVWSLAQTFERSVLRLWGPQPMRMRVVY